LQTYLKLFISIILRKSIDYEDNFPRTNRLAQKKF
jgi:hypothetical protein